MGQEPALIRFQIYGLAELTTVLGEPDARKDFELPPDFLKAAETHDMPSSGESPTGIAAPIPKQLLAWRCGSHARDTCTALGDPQADRWLATRLCNMHGGVPYDEATPAGVAEIAKREQWVAAFWSTLSAALPGLDRSGPDEGRYAEKRVRLESQAAGSSIDSVANISYSLQDARENPVRPLLSGYFYTVNATPAYAARDIALTLLIGYRVQISTSAEVLEGTLLAGPADAPAEIVVALPDGSRRSVDRFNIQAVKRAHGPI